MVDEIKKYTREWFAKNPDMQKMVVSEFSDAYNNAEYKDFPKGGAVNYSVFSGTKDEILEKYKSLPDGDTVFSEKEIIKNYGGVDFLFNLADSDKDGTVTEEEVKQINAVVNKNEFHQKDSPFEGQYNGFTQNDLRIIYENALSATDASYQRGSNNSEIFNFANGDKTVIYKDKTGHITKKRETGKGDKKNTTKEVLYDYNSQTKTEIIKDKNGQVRSTKTDAPNEEFDKEEKTYNLNLFGKEIKFSKTETSGQVAKTVSVDDKKLYEKQDLKFDSDGKIATTKQGTVGDCWLLSAVNSLNSTEKGQEIIKNAIHQNDDGSFTVKLKGVNKEYTYTPEHIASYAYSSSNKALTISEGDIDMNLIEMAVADYKIEKKEQMEKLKREDMDNYLKTPFADRQINKSNPLDGGDARDAIFYLTGLKYDAQALSSETGKKMEILDKKFEAADNYALMCDFKNPVGDNIVKDHLYSIKKVTEDAVYVVNPWDSSKLLEYPKENFIKNSSRLVLYDMSKAKP